MSVDGAALRRLADVVDDLGETPIDVDLARVLEADDETIRAQLSVTVPTEGDLEIATVEAPTPESGAALPTNDDPGVQRADNRDDQKPAGSEDDTDDPDLECEVDGCDFTTDSERGLAIHEGRAHDESEREPPIEKRIIDILEEEGEVSSSEVQLLLETSSDHYRNKLSKLQRNGKVESRKDPDDGRRRLYRLAGEPVEDDEESTEEDDAENGDTEEDPFIAASKKARQQEQEQESEEHDSGTSTEDDTPAQTSESEARTVDLEEDAADESPDQDAGDDVQVEFATGDEDADAEVGDEDDCNGFPRRCHCGEVLENSLELAVHRTEVHGVPQGTLGYLEPGEFEEIVRDAESPQDIVDATGWQSERVLRALGVYGLADVIGPDGIELSDLDEYEFDGVAGDAGSSSDDRDDVIDEPAPDSSADSQPEQRVANDGGTVAFQDFSASSGTGRRCQNCGSHVNKQFARVFEPEHEGAPRACPNCEDLIREGDGTIRKKRSGGGSV